VGVCSLPRCSRSWWFFSSLTGRCAWLPRAPSASRPDPEPVTGGMPGGCSPEGWGGSWTGGPWAAWERCWAWSCCCCQHTHLHQVGRSERACGQQALNKGDWLSPSLTGSTGRNIGTLTPPLVAGSKQDTLHKDMSSLSSAGTAQSNTYYWFLNVHTAFEKKKTHYLTCIFLQQTRICTKLLINTWDSNRFDLYTLPSYTRQNAKKESAWFPDVCSLNQCTHTLIHTHTKSSEFSEMLVNTAVTSQPIIYLRVYTQTHGCHHIGYATHPCLLNNSQWYAILCLCYFNSK